MPFISSVRGSYGAQGRFSGGRAGLAGSTGGSYAAAGGFGIHTFSSVGSFTFTAASAGNIEYLVVAGGGGGGTDGVSDDDCELSGNTGLFGTIGCKQVTGKVVGPKF